MKKLVFRPVNIFVPWLCLLSAGPAYGAERGRESAVLFRLTKCCPESAWKEAEYAVLKELDAMDVSVTLLDRNNDSKEPLEQEIEAVGASGKYQILLYFYKDSPEGVSGVRIAIFDFASQTSGTRRITYTVQSSQNAVSIVTLKAVEVVREVLFGPSPESMQTPAEPDTSPTSSTASAPKTSVVTPEETPQKKEPLKEKKDNGDKFPAASREASIEKTAEAVLPHRFAVGLGPVGWWSPGGAGPAFALQGAFNMMIKGALLAEINAAASLATKKIRSNDVGAEYRTILLRAAFFWRFLDKGRLHPMLGISGGVAMFRAAGLDNGAPGNRTDTEAVAVISGQGRLGVDLTNRWGLVFGADVAVYIPKVKIMLLDERAADIGRPMISGFCNLEFRF